MLRPNEVLPRYDPSRPLANECDVFTIGAVSASSHPVHVLDEAVLDLVLRELDTISDFVQYLTEKEALMRSGMFIQAAGEEELLAYYLTHKYLASGNRFSEFAAYTGVHLDEGHWDAYESSAQVQNKRESDRISYLWDEIVESASEALKQRHSIGDAGDEFREQELVFRALASEPRLGRRVLGKSLFEVVHIAAHNGRALARTMPSSTKGGPLFVLAAVPRHSSESASAYLRRRSAFLGVYSQIVALRNEGRPSVVGIATESGQSAGTSYDFAFVDNSLWTPETRAQVAENQKALGLFKRENQRLSRIHEYEYPEVVVNPESHSRNSSGGPPSAAP